MPLTKDDSGHKPDPDRPALWDGAENPIGLRFETADDAVNYGREIVDYAGDRESSHLASFVESYEKGQIELCVNFTVRLDGSKNHLVFFMVPFRRDRECPNGFFDAETFNVECSNAPSYCARSAVFVGACGPAETAEKIIPSWVRLERHDERVQGVWKSLVNPGSQIFLIGGEREVQVVGDASSYPLDAGARSLIESVPDVAKSGCRNVPSLVGERPIEDDLERLVSCLRVYINDTGAAAAIDDSIGELYKFGQVFARLSNQEFWTVESITHGKSDPKET